MGAEARVSPVHCLAWRPPHQKKTQNINGYVCEYAALLREIMAGSTQAHHTIMIRCWQL